MTRVQQVQGSIVALASLLAVALAVPAAAQVVDQDTAVVAAPAVASWDETSGYGAVERGRAALAPAENALGGEPRVSRASDMGSLQEDYLAATEMSGAVMPSGTASK